MTDAILGHDVDGRELRAGDRVEIVSANLLTELVGEKCNLVGPSRFEKGHLRTDLIYQEKFVTSWPSNLRLINSGRELFDQCAREADKMPTESTIRQRMPEPEES